MTSLVVHPRVIGDQNLPVEQCVMRRTMNARKALMQGLINLSPDCNAAVRLQSEAFTRKLSPTQRVGLSIHLFLCSWCRRYRAQIKKLRELGLPHEGRTNELPSGRTLSPEARERIQRSVVEVKRGGNLPN